MNQQSIWNKKFPTLLGMFLVLFGIGITSFLVKTGVIFSLHASPTNQPTDLRISNITRSSFTVSYQTPANTTGALSYGIDKNLTSSVFDDRDTAQAPRIRTMHYITIRDLKPDTEYFFSILSGQETFLNNGVLYNNKTNSKDLESNLEISGKVIESNGQPPTEAIVFITTLNNTTASSLVQADGSYRVRVIVSQSEISDASPIHILIASADGIAHAIISKKLSQIVPLVTIPNNYDFTINNQPLASTSAAAFLFPTLAIPTSKDPKIIAPLKDQKYTDTKPQFSGIASPSTTIKIIIHSSDVIQTQVTTDANGRWTYRPQTPLSPGQHIISVIAPNKYGILQTFIQSFTVYAAGTQVDQTATPSATATLTPIPQPSPTSASTPTATPTIINTPTPIPIIVPTDIPFPTAVSVRPALVPGSKAVLGLSTIAATSITTAVLLLLSL